MKDLVTYINEAMKVVIPKYTDKEPAENERKDWVKLDIHDKFFTNDFPALYIKLDDINGKKEDEALSIAYNVMKDKYGTKATEADMLVWGKDVNDESKNAWVQYATASLQKKTRMWHPEWSQGIIKE